jgi:peptidoglycan hydrolase-like protein with peptidoglycan-binding domain
MSFIKRSCENRRLTAGSAVLVMALMTLGMAPAAQAVAPAPPTKALPVGLDVQTPYEPQVSCDTRTQPGVTAFADLMKAHYKTGVAGTNRPCQGDVSEHYDGRALDWMLNVNNVTQKEVADSVTTWLSANNGAMARRFGVSYIIWNKKMWREYRPELGWVAYTGPVPHTDHVHFSFSWDGARKRTSWWTGTPTTVVDLGPCRVYAGEFAPLYTTIRTVPCPVNLPPAPVSAYPVYIFGQVNPQIAVAQQVLGVTANGQFGATTLSALLTWQAGAGVPITGVLDKATWAKMAPPVAPAPAAWAATQYTPYKGVVLQQGSTGAAVLVLQAGLGIGADGDFGPMTRTALVAFQTQQQISPTGTVARLEWDRLEQRDYPLIAYRMLSVQQGSSGPVVVAVQNALGVGADGDFGPQTAAAVKAVQLSAGLAQTGVVSEWTWVAIESQMSG